MTIAIYKQFLDEPSSSLLADNASLHYITTTTSIDGASEVMKHLSSLRRQLKKSEQVIYSIESPTTMAMAVQINTTIHFQTGGGAYMPQIDEAFLINTTAQLPIMHVVGFNSSGKITQICQHWDQGSLLKQIELIGKTGRNWPIRDGKEQLALIQSSFTSAESLESQAKDDPETPAKSRTAIPNTPKSVHESRRLFPSREDIEVMNQAEVVSPYAGIGAKHLKQVDFLRDEPTSGEENPLQDLPAKAGLGTPKLERIFSDPRTRESEIQDDPFQNSPAKAGRKEPQPHRIWKELSAEELENDEKPKPKLPHILAHPARFEHFEFSSGSNESSVPKPVAPFAQSPYSRHESQWSFKDFTTPVKVVPTKGMRKQEADEMDAREIWPSNQPSEPFISKKTNGAFGGSEATLISSGGALENITNTSASGRTTDREIDSAPTDKSQPKDATQSLIDAVKTLDINQASAGQSLSPRADRNENDKYQQDSRIRIAGNGMGGRAGSEQNSLFGGGDDIESYRPIVSRNRKPADFHSDLWGNL